MLAITQSEFGPAGVLTAVQVDRPQPLPTEVLVRVHATGINPIDAMIRAGTFPILGTPPFTLGWDISGTVEEVVPGTYRFQPGDEVYGMPFFPRQAGGYAEYIAAPSRMLARKPGTLSHTEAAALPLAGLTIWQALIETAHLTKGQRILIHGAGGGVGHLAVQLAKAVGAEVIGTASAGKHAFVRSQGADEVHDYRTVDVASEVRDVDVVFDLVGGDHGHRSLRSLRPGGVFVTAVDRGNKALEAEVTSAGRRFTGIGVEPDHVGLDHLTALAEQGLIRPHIEHVLPLTEAAKAHELIEAGHVKGKIVLTT